MFGYAGEFRSNALRNVRVARLRGANRRLQMRNSRRFICVFERPLQSVAALQKWGLGHYKAASYIAATAAKRHVLPTYEYRDFDRDGVESRPTSVPEHRVESGFDAAPL